MIEINAELTEEQALALAQFIKRCTWTDFRSNAVNDDEAYLMRDAADKIREALSEVGYSPR